MPGNLAATRNVPTEKWDVISADMVCICIYIYVYVYIYIYIWLSVYIYMYNYMVTSHTYVVWRDVMYCDVM